jgi:hypothetical protein
MVLHSMRNYKTEINDPRESLWKFTWANAVRAEEIVMGLTGAGLDLEVTQGYAIRNREWNSSATVTFQGTPRQAESLFHAILAKPWNIDKIRVEAHEIESTRVML